MADKVTLKTLTVDGMTLNLTANLQERMQEQFDRQLEIYLCSAIRAEFDKVVHTKEFKAHVSKLVAEACSDVAFDKTLKKLIKSTLTNEIVLEDMLDHYDLTELVQPVLVSLLKEKLGIK